MRPLAAAGLLTLILAGCAQQQVARLPGEAANRLPAELAGFRKGSAVPVSEGGYEVGFSTTGRYAAGATLELSRPGDRAFPAGATSAEAGRVLAQALAEATLPAPGRSVSTTSRFTVPANAPTLACAATSGRQGRQPVEGVVCAGGIAGNLVQLRASQPSRSPPPADLRAFATAVAQALAAP